MDNENITANRGLCPHLVVVMLVVAAAAYFVLRMYCLNPVPNKAGAEVVVDRHANSAAKSRVLLVHSYHTGYPWVDTITRGVRMGLSGSNVDLQIFYMDTKRHTDKRFKEEAGQAARNVTAEWKPDVIIAADDNAQQYFATYYTGRSWPQIVFCGVNAEPEEYGYPVSNITGILERPHFVQSLELLRQLVPDAKRIAMVSDDSLTSEGALKWIRKQCADAEIVLCEMPTTFEQWKSVIDRCQDKADAIAVYMYHTVKKSNISESMEPKDVMSWTVENSSIPIIGLFIFAVDDGALCGYVESGVEHGLRAGQMAVEMLRGRRADQLKVVTALEGQPMLNLSTARRLGIKVHDEIIRQMEVLVGE